MSVVENAARDLLRLHVLVQGYPDRLKQVCASCQQDYPCDTAIAALAALEVDTLTAERDAARAAGEQVRVLREAAWVALPVLYKVAAHDGLTPCEYTPLAQEAHPKVQAALALTPTEAEQRVARLVAVEAAIPELLAARAELADASGWDIDRLYAAIDQLAAAAGTGEVGA
jgi:hypothetical protein